ncbi:MAG: hypothetical protein K6E24_00430, partial [bacterium]|nr:hypothetical protein [bacterium]
TITNSEIKTAIYKVSSGRLYADSNLSENAVYPVIFIDKTAKAKSGIGTLDNPYSFTEQEEVGEE